MGKTSKWITNFLIGKKEQNHKKLKNASFSAEYLGSSNIETTQPATPKMKLRWSFGRKTSKQTGHKVSKSFDSFDSHNSDNNTARTLATKRAEAENAAAIKIQSVYRSHLARKALHALRGLVKIQALVRGHLVRKQTAAALRSMQALMAIQVRARVHRIQILEEDQLLERRRLSTSRHFDIPRKPHGERRMDVNLNKRRESLMSKSDYLNHLQVETIEHELTTYYSGPNVLISKRQHQYEKYSLTTEPNSPQNYLNRPKLNSARIPITSQPEYLNHLPHDSPFYPNFMANTTSSRAKVRSQSEPKQRPGHSTKQKCKQVESVSGMSLPVNDKIQDSSAGIKRNGSDNHDPWFMKIYHSGRVSRDRICGSVSTKSSHSDYRKSSIAHEPHSSLY